MWGLMFLIPGLYATCQVGINDSGSLADPEAMLDVKSTSKVFLPPRMNMAQRDAIINPPEGSIIFCSDCYPPNSLYYFGSGNWHPFHFNLCKEVNDYINGLSVPLSTTQQDNLNNLVISIKSGMGITNLSDAFDVMYILAGETQESSLKNLVSGSFTSELGGTTPPVFSAFNGFTGDGNHGYINTTYRSSSDKNVLSLNNNSMGIFANTIGNGNNKIMAGALTTDNSAGFLGLYSREAGSAIYINNFISTTTSGNDTYNNTNGTVGLNVTTRTSSGQYRFYHNASLVKTVNKASVSLNTLSMYITCCHYGTGEYARSTATIAMMFMGRGLSTNDVSTIYNAFKNYLRASTYYFVSATINDTTNDQIDILFDHDLNANSVPASSAFTVSGKTVSGVTISGRYIKLTVTVPFTSTDAAGTISYVPPESNPIKATNGVLVMGFDQVSMINGIFEIPVNDRFDNGKLVLTFDDGHKTNYTYLFPMLQQEGVTCTLFISGIGTNNENSGPMTWSNMTEMNNYGINLENHTEAHTDFTLITDAEIMSSINNKHDSMVVHGLPAPYYIAYPYGGFNAHVLSVIDTMKNVKGGRLDGITSWNPNRYIGKSTNKYKVTAAELTTSMIDICKHYKVGLVFTGHATYPSDVTQLQALIQYAKSIGVDIITYKQLMELIN
jgi:peptidoglycan/xylan/chitin deacetylase (PgdA/CDA1 family)